MYLYPQVGTQASKVGTGNIEHAGVEDNLEADWPHND
jgi:hypothetical protein